MSQSDLNRAIARATGESVHLIESLGFGELHLPRPRQQRPRRARRIPVRATRPWVLNQTLARLSA
jgi:hypothetical protein